MITSGLTGWDPNAARSFKAKSIMGPWENWVTRHWEKMQIKPFTRRAPIFYRYMVRKMLLFLWPIAGSLKTISTDDISGCLLNGKMINPSLGGKISGIFHFS